MTNASVDLLASLPRERAMLEGFESLADADLIAVLLGTGEKGRPATQVAADLLSLCGGIPGIHRMGAHALAEVRGVGLAKAARIAAGYELGRRVLMRGASTRPVFASSAEVAGWARARLMMLDHEQVWVLVLDGRNRLRTARRVAEGGLHGCSLEPRDVLRAVLRDAGSSFVLVHNHPSGDPAPSDEDIHLTNLVGTAASIVGTPLVDHVIVAGAAHSSLFDLGVMGKS